MRDTSPATNTDQQQQFTAQQALFKAEERAKIMLKGTKTEETGQKPLNVLFALTCSILSLLVCPQDPSSDIYLFKSSLAADDKLCLSTKLDKTKSHLNGTKQKIMLRIVTGDCSELLL